MDQIDQDIEQELERDGVIYTPGERVVPGEFFWDVKELKKEGQVTYENVPMIRLTIDSKNTLVRKARALDKAQRRYQWRKFLQSGENSRPGFPLSEWISIRPAEVKMLAAKGLQTVEDLAEASSTQLGFLGGITLKEKAKAYLEARKGGAAVSELAEQLMHQREENEELRARLAALEAAAGVSQAGADDVPSKAKKAAPRRGRAQVEKPHSDQEDFEQPAKAADNSEPLDLDDTGDIDADLDNWEAANG